jgi:two-component system phosphate regulon response regulator OmpR
MIDGIIDVRSQAEKGHILVVDDDDRIRTLVSRFLHEHDFIVLTASEANSARDILDNFVFDALVVDIMMPGETGLEFTKSLREKGIDTPVLLLTALGEGKDRIMGFESGADDYLPKPFEPKELVLRLQAIIKRTGKYQKARAAYRIGRWLFDTRSDVLEDQEGAEIRLTSAEVTLLRAFLEKPDEVMSREDLAKRCGFEAGERTVDVQITRLRRKLESNTKIPRYLITIRGKGYLLRAERV